MWKLAVPVWELVVRGVVVYLFLVILLRLTGKRQVGQLAPFDLVLLLVLSNAVQNAMNGGDNSVLGGMISAVTLISLNWLLGVVTYRSHRLARLIEGRAEVIIHNGKVDHEVMARERLTQSELDTALRRAGCASVADVHFAVLENNGDISVRLRTHRPGADANEPQAS
jgi:uncharacterized membrane protein YcaP (DUF421 family)